MPAGGAVAEIETGGGTRIQIVAASCACAGIALGERGGFRPWIYLALACPKLKKGGCCRQTVGPVVVCGPASNGNVRLTDMPRPPSKDRTLKSWRDAGDSEREVGLVGGGDIRFSSLMCSVMCSG